MKTSPPPPSEPQGSPDAGLPPSGTLAEAAVRCGLSLPAEQLERIECYCRMLWDWNARLNLTRHNDFDKFASRDLVDTLAFSQVLASGERVLDVGTGGGVPGVVLAIVRPDLRVELCESIGKKARAVADMVSRLGLAVPVHHARAEAVLAESQFDSLLIRAVAPMKTLLEWFRPHWPKIGRLLLLKGPSWVEERGESRHYGLLGSLALRKILEYANPVTQAPSVLLSITAAEHGKKAADRAKKNAQPSPQQKQKPSHGPSPRGLRTAAGARRDNRSSKQPPSGGGFGKKPSGRGKRSPGGKARRKHPSEGGGFGKKPSGGKPSGKQPPGGNRR